MKTFNHSSISVINFKTGNFNVKTVFDKKCSSDKLILARLFLFYGLGYFQFLYPLLPSEKAAKNTRNNYNKLYQ